MGVSDKLEQVCLFLTNKTKKGNTARHRVRHASYAKRVGRDTLTSEGLRLNIETPIQPLLVCSSLRKKQR